jgi:uncharacterized protein YqhQ
VCDIKKQKRLKQLQKSHLFKRKPFLGLIVLLLSNYFGSKPIKHTAGKPDGESDGNQVGTQYLGVDQPRMKLELIVLTDIV